MKNSFPLPWILLLILSLIGACARMPPVTPFTADLYRRLELDNTNIGNIQVYYRAKQRRVDMPRTRDTLFSYETSERIRSVSVGKRPEIAEETRTVREHIILYNGTPCVIVNAEQTRGRVYRLQADFGDGIILEFENNRPDGIFYLITDRIVLKEHAYVLEEGCYGYLALALERSSGTSTRRAVYEVRGKALE